ncbi:MAG: ABC transporter ATP-binding protein [Ferrovum sp.]|nr:ABC transporter ATP-binding protein [Ferrovum sp.]
MTVPLLEVRDLRISFVAAHDPPVEAVRGVSFRVPDHSTVALVGESGSGKSVTALSILRLLPPENTRIDPASKILWEGKDILQGNGRSVRALRGKSIGTIFQDPMSALNPVLSIGMQLMEPLRLHLGLSRREARSRAVELLLRVGIDDAEKRLESYPHQLSGGQQQRVMIAMAISTHPRLLIADEPTTALDVTVQRQIMDLLGELQQQLSMAILFITHDLALVGEFAQEIVVMRGGEVQEVGNCSAVLSNPHSAYTRALLACRPPLEDCPARLPMMGVEGNLIMPQGGQRAESPGGPPILEVDGVSKRYDRPGKLWRRNFMVALAPVSFTLLQGKTLGVVGESGSGKSTLGRIVAGILAANDGTLRFFPPEGKGSASSARRVQMVFQNPFSSLNPRFTVAQILTEPLLLHSIGQNRGERLALAQQWLERVGLSAQALGRYPHEFSGGQRQRIAIARCLTLNPRILICDESVSALDVSVQAQILNLLRDLQDELHISYLFISHDLAVVRFMADEVLVLQGGKVVERGPVEQIYHAPQHPYTQKLLQAIPRGVKPYGGSLV